MQLDHQRFLKEGAPYIKELILQSSEEPWAKLVKERMPDAPPADIEGMKTLWMHGFHIGAEMASDLINKLFKK